MKKKSAMHILVVTNLLSDRWDASPVTGGYVSGFAIEQAECMRNFGGHKVNIWQPRDVSVLKCLRKRKPIPARHNAAIEESNGVEIYFNYNRRYVLPIGIAAAFYAKDFARQYAQKHGAPDILWTQTISRVSAAAAAHLAKVFNIPYFAVEHNPPTWILPPDISPRQKAKHIRQKRALSKFLNNALFVAAVSAFAQRHMSLIHPQTKVLHNPATLPVDEKEIGADSNAPHFVFCNVGRLEKDKGQHIVIAAFARLLKDLPDIRLKIVGDGSYKNQLQQQASALGVADKVAFMGLLSRAEVKDALLKSDAYVSASEYVGETFNLGLAEALMCGLPSVATPTGVAFEAIDKTSGIRTDKFDEESIYQAMAQVCRNRQNYDKRLIHRRAKEMFSPETYAQNLTAMINQG